MVRKYKRKTDRANISQEDLSKAIREVISHKRKIRDAAAIYNINKSTLHFHVKKKRSINGPDSGHSSDFDEETNNFPSASKYASRQIFSATEESELESYLHKASAMNFGLTYKHARALAFQYAKKLSKNYPAVWDNSQMAGIEWMRSFMKRHPKLSYRKPENISIARMSGFNKTNVETFFRNYTEVMAKYSFSPDRIVNTDETGVSTVMQAPRIIAETGKKQVGQTVSSERGTLVTFCGIITATGVAIPPIYVFPRVRMKECYLYGSVPGATGYATKSGWMSSEVFVKLLEHIQKHMSSSRENPIMLLLDNHETHVSLDAINYCRANGIVMLSFPPHCTHRMQPLDIGVYGPFKARCKSSFNDYILSNPGKAITIYDIAKLTSQPYLLSFTPLNIINAFKKAGIWPVNRLAYDDTDFAGVLSYEQPSTSTQVQNEGDLPAASEEINHFLDLNLTQSSNLDLTQGSENLIPEEITIVEFMSHLMEEVLTNVFRKDLENSAKQSPRKLVNLNDIRPFPFLQPKQNNRRARKKGRSCIYTDTPEKDRIEAAEKEKQEKRAKSVKRRVYQSEDPKDVSKKPRKKPKKSSYTSSSSESDLETVSAVDKKRNIMNYSSDSDIDLQSEHDDINGLLDDEEVKVGDFVLVKFATKKKVLHFVGHVEELLGDYGELLVKFLRLKPNRGFYYPIQDDFSTITRADIVFKLPPPQESKGTSRQASYIKFQVSFFQYTIQ